MKKILPVVLSLFLFAGSAAAQEHRAHLFVLPGVSFPASPDDLTLHYKVGPNAGFSWQKIKTDKLGFLVEFNYQRYAVKPEKTLARLMVDELGATLSGGSITALTVMGNVVLSQVTEGSKGIPYFTAGLGIYSAITDDISVSLPGVSFSEEGSVSIVPGLNIGAGVKYFVKPDFGLALDGRYTLGFTSDYFSHLLSLRIGMIFTLK